MSDIVTVRDLITRRIVEEAARLAREAESRARLAERFRLRVAPPVTLDLDAAATRAFEAFARDDIRVLVGDRPAASLEERIPVAAVPDVTVVATVPLVGG